MVLKHGSVALVCAALPASFAHAASLLEPGSGNPDLTLPAGTPAQAVWSPASSDPNAPYYDIDWSLGLRGAYIADNNGERFQ